MDRIRGQWSFVAPSLVRDAAEGRGLDVLDVLVQRPLGRGQGRSDPRRGPSNPPDRGRLGLLNAEKCAKK